MATYSEESLDKLLKKDIINTVLSLQTEMQSKITEMQSNTKILEEVRKLNDKFTNLESQLLVTKNVNSLLQERVIDFERKCWANAQYSKRECLEVAGIPKSVKQNELEDKVLRIFKKFGSDIPSDNIEACHRVGRHNNVIIKFSKRKDCQQIFSVKKDLSKLDMKEVDLPKGTQIFVNQSLCPYYKSLWSKSKKLGSLGKSIVPVFQTVQQKENSNSIAPTVKNFSQMLIYPHQINKSS